MGRDKARNARHAAERRARLRAAGCCVRCATPCPGRGLCLTCYARHLDYRRTQAVDRRQYRARCAEKRCVRCRRPVTKYVRCTVCRADAAEALRAYRHRAAGVEHA